MKLDIYENNWSVVPVAQVASMGELLMWLAYHGDVAERCARIRATGDKSEKGLLPAVMFMGRLEGEGKTRRAENCVPTGLVMVDVDKVEDVGRIKEVLPRHVDVLERLGVRLVHITPSYHGLRIVLPCLKEGMQATVDKVATALAVENWGKVDPACKDLSRLSYLVPKEYVLYEKGLCDEVPAESVDAMRRGVWGGGVWLAGGGVADGGAVSARVEDVVRSDAEWADFEFRGHRVKEIAEAYVEQMGVPEKGTRHNCYNGLVKEFRNICNNDPRIVHAVLPKFGNGDAETWSQCEAICRQNSCTRIGKKLWRFLKEGGYWDEPEEEKEGKKDGQEEDGSLVGALLELELPPVFKQYVGCAPRDFKVPVVMALMSMLGTLASYLRAVYFDGSEQSTAFFVALYAPASSGKGFVRRVEMEVMKNLRERDALSNAREELYAQAERRKGANDRGGEPPRVSVRMVKPLISTPEMLQKMRDNKGHHMYIESEELDTFAVANKSMGDKSDLWRVAWDNGAYGQYYKSVHTFKGEVQLYLNLLFTGTRDQLDRFFVNVEDGLVTRFSVCPIEHQQFARFVPWRKMTVREREVVDGVLQELECKNYVEPLTFDPACLPSVGAKEFDRVVPWKYEFCPLERVDLSYMYAPLQGWLEEERLAAVRDADAARDAFRRRVAVKGFRLALLCHGLYGGRVGRKEREVIKRFVLWFCRVDLQHSLDMFGSRYNALQGEVDRREEVPQPKLFNALPREFCQTMLQGLMGRMGVKTPLRKVVSLWFTNGLIEKQGDNNRSSNIQYVKK